MEIGINGGAKKRRIQIMSNLNTCAQKKMPYALTGVKVRRRRNDAGRGQ